MLKIVPIAIATVLLLPLGLDSAEARVKKRSRSRSTKAVKWVKATAYCIGPCRTCQTRGVTYTGTRGLRGIAVARRARKVAPLGSRMFVGGYGWARVDDVGGGVGSRQIDLRFRSHQRAKKWGKRWIKVVYVPPRGT